jgi:hypothetical protein
MNGAAGNVTARKSQATDPPRKKTLKRSPAKKPAARKALAGKTSAKKAPAKKTSARKAPAKPLALSQQRLPLERPVRRSYIVFDPEVRVERINAITGSARQSAVLLDVDVAQVSRWSRGESVPDPEHARTVLDVEYVLSYALTVWADTDVAHDWLTTPNAHLDGITPMCWIKLHGTAEVVDALRAEASGAYA